MKSDAFKLGDSILTCMWKLKNRLFRNEVVVYANSF
jgi:hypothetical protein